MKLHLPSSLLASVLLLSACGEKSEEKPAVAAGEASTASNSEPTAPVVAKDATTSVSNAANVSDAKLRAYVCNAADPSCRA
ncbi:hypothetical protein [Stenotrophomonas oahuensis]|uniref:Uncharacterized protein n=1 Tax=Stenotrophomonas oahuensis TaxID=3003271 RepID=A0ABY9YSL5_9GAMM|nr:hypothetical protein [Stenotrophomonas sp. A5586]WNH53871.1 hypothetical protein PDM29_06210 [Stenotrophomonas sp. A5586]